MNDSEASGGFTLKEAELQIELRVAVIQDVEGRAVHLELYRDSIP